MRAHQQWQYSSPHPRPHRGPPTRPHALQPCTTMHDAYFSFSLDTHIRSLFSHPNPEIQTHSPRCTGRAATRRRRGLRLGPIPRSFVRVNPQPLSHQDSRPRQSATRHAASDQSERCVRHDTTRPNTPPGACLPDESPGLLALGNPCRVSQSFPTMPGVPLAPAQRRGTRTPHNTQHTHRMRVLFPCAPNPQISTVGRVLSLVLSQHQSTHAATVGHHPKKGAPHVHVLRLPMHTPS